MLFNVNYLGNNECNTDVLSEDCIYIWAFQVTLAVKNLPASAGDTGDSGSTPGWERCPGGGQGNLLQYSCLEDPMDRGAWWATVHGASKSQT